MSCIFPQLMLLARPCPGGLQGFLHTDLTPELLAKHLTAITVDSVLSCAEIQLELLGYCSLDTQQ